MENTKAKCLHQEIKGPLRARKNGSPVWNCPLCGKTVTQLVSSLGSPSGSIVEIECPAPSLAMQKENGKWTFYIYPDGVAEEVPEKDTEEEATAARYEILQIWEANGRTYGPVGTITKQTNVVVSGPPPGFVKT